MRLLVRLLVPLVLAFGVVAGWSWHWLRTPAPGYGQAVVVIPRGSGLRQISQILSQKGLIRGEMPFMALARLRGQGGHIRAGEFSLAKGQLPGQILAHLVSGPVVLHRLTIPEGRTMDEIAELFAGQGWGEASRFRALARDGSFLASLGLQVQSAEGYLFPDTYAFTLDERNAETIIARMVHRFQEVWLTLDSPVETDLDQHQVVTLASIIEKETGTAQERPMIARVFLNRLQRGMRLQSDPTVTYGLVGSTGPITRAQLRANTPYNTYVIDGLPPGPICNPGLAALAAVYAPADSTALYFVSKNDGTHHFSSTLKEHNRMVRRYQR